MAIRPANPAGSQSANPFGGGGGGGGTNNPTTSLVQQFRVQLPNGAIVAVNSQAEVDALKANYAQPTVIPVNDQGGGGAWNMAGDAAQTIGGFLAGRGLRDRVADADDARSRLMLARPRVEAARAESPQLAAAMLDALDNLVALNDAQTDALDVMITAVDINAGAGAVKLVGEFARGEGGFGSGASGGMLMAGAGLGLGVLLTGNSSRNSRRR